LPRVIQYLRQQHQQQDFPGKECVVLRESRGEKKQYAAIDEGRIRRRTPSPGKFCAEYPPEL
jgi:hypothetical protein